MSKKPPRENSQSKIGNHGLSPFGVRHKNGWGRSLPRLFTYDRAALLSGQTFQLMNRRSVEGVVAFG